MVVQCFVKEREFKLYKIDMNKLLPCFVFVTNCYIKAVNEYLAYLPLTPLKQRALTELKVFSNLL